MVIWTEINFSVIIIQSLIIFKLMFRFSEIDKAILENTKKVGILLENYFVLNSKLTDRSPKCVNINDTCNIET